MEIKFRGLAHTEDGAACSEKWVYGNLIIADDGQCFIVKWHQEKGIGYKTTIWTVKPESVGQYTGINDISSNDVYKDDICEGQLGHICQVVWIPHLAKWGMKVIKSDHVLIRNLTFPMQHYINENTTTVNVRVIGNIYQNPELLSNV